MTLIIKEDETSLERIPPYGSESFHAYYLKIKENLDYLRDHEFARVCFETSVLETMFVLDNYPEIKKEFIELIKNKKLSFVGGTYGQVHTQTLTSESNFKQFEMGLKKYKELFDIDISLYAVQEPGHHEQMPQLLKAFGIKFATLPAFTYSLIFLEEYELVSFMEIAWMKFTRERGMEQDQITRICFTNDNEFAMWTGLDNTELPLYLIDPMRWCRKEDIKNEYKKDLYSSPVVRLYLTDLIDFNPQIIKETLEHAEFELADKAIEERFQKLGKGPKARLYSYYSYLEGSKADKSYIKNRYLENIVCQAQALESYFILNNFNNIPDINWDGVWKVILETQHHDICYPDAPQLQEWAVKKMDDVFGYLNIKIKNLKDSLIKYLTEKEEVKNTIPGNIISFNSEPHNITSITRVQIPKGLLNNNLSLMDKNNKNIDYQVEKENELEYIVFLDIIDGFGIKTLNLAETNTSLKEEKLSKGRIENNFYSCNINDWGELQNILIKKSEKILFEDCANKLSAYFNDETPVKFEMKPENFIQKSGKVYDLVVAEGIFDKSTYKKELKFYRKIPRIDFKITFIFKDQQIGNIFLEETKLCTVWPIKNLKIIKHDIPFGVVEGRKSRPLYALNWINCELKNNIYFTILPKGKIKFFEKDGLLYNLIAWGDEGVEFMRVGGTCAPEILQGHFYLKLEGEYNFEYSLYLHDNKPTNLDLFKIAVAYSKPFISIYSNNALKLNEDIILKFNTKGILSSSIFTDGKSVKCRFFECDGNKEKIDLNKRADIKIREITDIFGDKTKEMSPFRIAEMDISRI
jgi:hypothetical protein